MRVIEIDRGNGLKELVVVGGENENVSEINDKGSGHIPVPAADLKGRDRGAVKGYYRGRDGITVLFDRLRDRGRKK
jgi:hypothetical protein